MSDPYDVWDDPEDFLQDEEPEMAPGEPAHTSLGYDLRLPTEQGVRFAASRAEVRERRLRDIADHLSTRGYRKPELGER